jgi:hypothetical protein
MNVALIRAEALATLDALERAWTVRADRQRVKLCWRESAVYGRA